jgi:hypothetical protein
MDTVAAEGASPFFGICPRRASTRGVLFTVQYGERELVNNVEATQRCIY